jgi:hypothetical protein
VIPATQPPTSLAAAAAGPAGYEDVAGAAFGWLGRLLVSGVMYAELLGICCVYIVLEVGGCVCALSGCNQSGGAHRGHCLKQEGAADREERCLGCSSQCATSMISVPHLSSITRAK